MELNKIYHMDAFEGLKLIPDKSVNLAILDPPYNIGVITMRDNRPQKNAWDKITNYQEWIEQLLKEVYRVLTDNGVMYLWHNDMQQIADILHNSSVNRMFTFRSFCIWDKGKGYRAQSWANRRENGATALRSWFNICEYCLHFFKDSNADSKWRRTGLERINSNPECYRPLKDWYNSELMRLGITEKDVAEYYTLVTGKKPHMLRHYFKDSQFEIPTKKVWESVYIPIGFGWCYEELRQGYEELRQGYEELRHPHHVDAMHCNIWHIKALATQNRLHTCQKPLEIIERLISVSSNDGAVILDPFMGSGTTAVAAINTGRRFIGFEREQDYFDIAQKRITEAQHVASAPALPFNDNRQPEG